MRIHLIVPSIIRVKRLNGGMAQKLDVAAEITRVLQLEGESILLAAKRLGGSAEQGHELLQAVELLQRSLLTGGKIIVTGVGKSGKIGQKIAATLSSTGSMAIYLHPTEGL